MRILYFSPRECWPLNTGARLRDYHFARELAGRARVTYMGLRSPKDLPVVEPPCGGFVRSVLVEMNASYTPGKIVRGLLGPVPVTVLNFWSARAAVELERLLNGPEHFDTVQMEGVHLIQYLPVVQGSRRPPAVVADWHNIESEILLRFAGTASSLARRVYARRTAQLIENMEMRLLRGCDVHVVPSRRERDKLLARLPGVRIEVVGNGVDVGHYSDDRLSADGRAAFPGIVERRDVLFVGSMDYHANIDAVVEFAAQTWPGIRARHPSLRFVVAGRNPPPQIRALAELPQVEVTGTVDDVRPWYCSAIVVVVPLRTGSGTRLKILEAMAAGVPVVSTRLGAEGLDVTDGVDIVLAETALETTDGVDELVRSPERRGAIAAGGRELVRNHYDWAILGARLFEVHHSVNRSPGSDQARA